MKDNNRVLLGMSGGVDSSVAAYLLKKEGYEVVGANMQLWDYDDDYENTSARDAKKVCDFLGIEFHIIDFKNDFKSTVVDYFINEYHEGHTPNPCVFCNKHIKFSKLYEKADELNCKYVATGHYATVKYNDENGLYELRRSVYDKKDQTYVLYNLNQEKLSRTLFPIGHYDKPHIRKIAEEIGLEVYNKPDSMDICFIPDQDYQKFLNRYSEKKAPEGSFVDSDGNVLGRHKGVTKYTIGQRKGLGVTFGEPKYVIDINGKNNRVTLGSNEDLFKNKLTAKDANFLYFDMDDFDGEKRFEAKIRYSSKPSIATVRKIGDRRIEVEFDEPQRAITKGQSVVFYDGELLIGGGVIE